MIPHKHTIAIAALPALAGLFVASAHADPAQVNWGSQVFSSIVDSNGQTLSEANFVFELGAFAEGFSPTESNVEDWEANWFLFDQAAYSETNGFFSASYEFYDQSFQGTSDFAGVGISRDAYIWVYNDRTAVPGTEWFVGRASEWVFPELVNDGINNDLPLEWSMSDLTAGDVPLFGNQFNFEGPGVRTIQDTNADLQTYTFIPEPSSALLVALAGLMGVTRRSRPQS